MTARLPEFEHAASRAELVQRADSSLLELVDHVLDKGCVIDGELVLGLADVDLVYVRLSALICAADRVLPRSPPPPSSGAGSDPA